MPTINFHTGICTCGSKRLAKDCCFRPAGDLAPNNHAHAHDRCYASALNTCSEKITLEHWVSKSVLQLFVTNNSLLVGGLPKCPPDQVKPLTVQALQSKILCDRHNSRLSPLDQTGFRFFSAIHNPQNISSKNELPVLICGENLERYLLKILCGTVAAGILMPSGVETVRSKPPLDWLNHLFKGPMLPSSLGLYVLNSPSTTPTNVNQWEMACISTDGNIYGLIIGIFGLRFILSMVDVSIESLPNDSLLRGASYRPSTLTISRDDSTTTILIDWSEKHRGNDLNIKWQSLQHTTPRE